MKHVTVYDIAEEAQVSVATVSRVLNGTAPVSRTTRDRIEAIMLKHQFRPNAVARSLTKRETGIIGVLLPDITNPFFPEVFSGIEQEGLASDNTFFVCNTLGDYGRESHFLRLMREKRVDGILFMGGRVNLKACDPSLARELAEHARGIPLVVVNGDVKNAGLTRVATDEAAGTGLAVRHLIGLGHTHIGFLGGAPHMSTTAVKLRAFRSAMRQAGLAVEERWMIPGGFSADAGREQMERLLALGRLPTAVCCVNDFTAIGAIKAAVERGLQVPADISVVGFDDILLARHVLPELTTVSQQAGELGRTAVRVLRQLMGGGARPRKTTMLAPELVLRQSTAAPGGGAAACMEAGDTSRRAALPARRPSGE